MRRKKFIPFFLLISLFVFSISASASDYSDKPSASDALIEIIKQYEGFSSTYYADGDGYAIGYGTHCDTSLYPDGITEEEAEELMIAYLDGMSVSIYEMMDKLNIELTQNQFDALLCLTYNLGTSWMNSSYSLYNMLAAGIDKYSDDEIINTFGRYCNYQSSPLEALAWRRLAEAKMFLYSDYRFGGTPNYELDLENEDKEYFTQEGDYVTISKLSDVTYTDWYYKYVTPLYTAGTISGYTDGTFGAENSVTYGETLKLILLAAGYDEQSATDEHWASGYLSLAIELGILDDADIDLDSYISRLDCVEIMCLALGIDGIEIVSPFIDCDNEYVLTAYDNGYITGSYNEDNELCFYPDNELTRAEICTIIWKMTNYIG